MTLDDILQQLTQFQNCNDPNFQNAAGYIYQAAQQAQSGQLSPSELVEILNDLQGQISILQDMSGLQYKEQLNTIINGLIALAGAV